MFSELAPPLHSGEYDGGKRLSDGVPGTGAVEVEGFAVDDQGEGPMVSVMGPIPVADPSSATDVISADNMSQYSERATGSQRGSSRWLKN